MIPCQTHPCHQALSEGVPLEVVIFACEREGFPSQFPFFLFQASAPQYVILAPQDASHLVSLGVFVVVGPDFELVVV